MNIGSINSIFAAANSFQGFKSLFKSTFNCKDYDKIFIVKGGPGTGKSTLMKNVVKKIKNRSEAQITQIFCSSDPASLDGIIIECNDRKIALLDGTAPHTHDPSVPMLCEEIINTAKGLSEVKLREKREEIFLLNEAKKKAYDKGYSYLRLAGTAREFLNDIIFDLKTYSEAEVISRSLLHDFHGSKKIKKSTEFYKSSFSKHGYFTLPRTNQNSETDLAEFGFKGEIIMKVLLTELSNKGILKAVARCPLDRSIPEFIYLEDGVIKCEYRPYFEEEALPFSKDAFKLNGIVKNALDGAKEAFAAASEAHFSLEEIYSSCMDFDINSKLESYVIKKTESILS